MPCSLQTCVQIWLNMIFIEKGYRAMVDFKRIIYRNTHETSPVVEKVKDRRLK